MKKLVFSILSCVLSVYSVSQSASATYTAGDIGSDQAAYSAATTCNGDNTPLVVNIPAGAIVTGVDVQYNMTALGGGWQSEQRSQIFCQETNTDEGGYINGPAINSGGTANYNRTSLTFANGVSASGVLTFEMRTFRTWTGTAGCNSAVQKVDNNTWTITVYYTLPVAQTYTSSTTTQNNTSDIPICSSNQVIVGVEIVTSGSLTPLRLSDLRLRTDGSTDVLNDVSNVDVYYTGNSNTFETSNYFGSAAPLAPGNNFFVSGDQLLEDGTNYFWVTYDIAGTATIGNSLDMRCTRVVISDNANTINTTYTPTVINPAGTRTIGICNPGPGGNSFGLAGWFDASNGTVGTSPVTTWNNLGYNANIPSLTSTGNPVLQSGLKEYNFNNAVDLDGGYAGTFHHEVSNSNDVITGDGVSMYCVFIGSGTPDLVFEFHGSINSTDLTRSANNWQTYGFRHNGIGSMFNTFPSTQYAYPYTFPGVANSNVNFVGMKGTENGSGTNSTNGIYSTYNIVGNFNNPSCEMELSIGYWPGYGTGRPIAEAIIYDKNLSATEMLQLESYLAIKYGITLGTNGTSKDYLCSDASVVWDQSVNSAYAWDIAGIMRDDASDLSQMKSHSTQGPSNVQFNDIVTIANGANFGSPVSMTADRCAFVWGHNNGPTENTGAIVNITTDNGENIQSIFQRHWKSQETGTVGTVTLEFDLSSVMGASTTIGNNDLANLRLLVDEDGDFTNGATAYSPTSFNNGTDIAYFQHDFTSGTGVGRGFFFTLASTQFNTTPLPVDLIDYQVVPTENQTALNLWLVENEKDIDYYLIEKSVDGNYWEEVGTVERVVDNEDQKTYSLEDAQPHYGTSYYRLTEIDMDGEISTQEIRPFKLNAALGLEIYPNPSNGSLNILLSGDKEKVDHIQLMNAMGQTILLKSEFSVNKTEVNSLASGLYTVVLTDVYGNQIIKKVVVN